MLDSYTKQLKDISEEERIELRDRIVNYNIDNFQDARKTFSL